MKKRIVALLVVLIVAVGAMLGWRHFRTTEDRKGWVFVSGNIEATEVDLSFRLSGQIKTLLIEEGDRVKKDQVVASLDTDTLIAQKGVAQAEVASARATLDELETGYRKEEIEMARALHKAAELRLKNAQADYERYAELYKENVISPSQYDARETAFRVAQEEFANTGQRLLELETGQREERIRAARAALERSDWLLKKIVLDIEHSELITPVSGVVLVKANELGEVVLPGATVTTVAAIDEVWLKGYVGERDLGRIKLGQRANITTDTYPGKIYPGKITFISSRSEFTPKNVQTKEERVKQVYRVKITLPNPHQELKIGMPAEGYILTDNSTPRGEGVADSDQKPR